MATISSDSYADFTIQVAEAVKAGARVEIDTSAPGFHATVEYKDPRVEHGAEV